MGPLEVAAGIAAVLVAAVVGIWVAVRRRDRRRRVEVERRDDAMVRAQVLERLARVTAEWEGLADQDVTHADGADAYVTPADGADADGADADGADADGADADGADEDRAPVGDRPAVVTGPGHAVDEHPRHRRAGHGTRVRRHRRA